jgi:hypothetical protein
LTTESPTALRVSTPDEEMSGGSVTYNTTLVGEEFIPTEGRLALPNQHEEIPLSFRLKTGVEVFFGGGIACPAGNEQYPPEHLDRVFRQFGLSKERAPYLVVTDNVPPMQGVLIAKVRNELRNRHSSPGPLNDAVRIDFEHVCNQTPHPLLFNVEAK